MLNLPIREIAAILKAEVQSLTEDIFCQGVSIDSRTIEPGNLFIAVKGETLDGHNYVAQAYQNGAVAAVVSRPIDCAIPQILVPDTLFALGELAANWRGRFNLPIVAVTGSNGKTTVKNMVGSILSAQTNQESVLMTQGNLNNQFGMPLTLLKLNAQHKLAVIEMGMNHFGELSYLTQMAKPTVAVITNASTAHLEGVGDLQGVATAKGEIFQGLPANGVAVINQDDPHADYWRSLVAGKHVISFGLTAKADVSAADIKFNVMAENGGQTQFSLQTPQGIINIQMPFAGDHNVYNAVAAASCA